MSNQSIISVPPNVEEPVVLQRFLSRLVEQLDIVLGNRAGPNDQYVSQEQLLAQAEELTALLEVAQRSLEQALDRLEDVDELIVEELTKRISAVEQKNVEQDARLDGIDNVLDNIVPYKAVMLSFTVDGLGEPDININFNINAGTASRISTGLYEFSVNQLTVDGNDILSNSITTLAWVIAPDVLFELFQVAFIGTGTPGTFRIQVSALVVGVGNKLEVQPYDLQIGDTVDASALYNVPGSVLPSV